ncbi:DUF3833 family protein [Tropicibacter oceani]|uniref:DUF3833 family protein n=1 Tax=Tropicibacter oceani TaxID=3058420 RepID=A0ABY8QJI9_9RHOB|nr:DUF3833 family protein [Tropicibacter oceani]WGW04163.1 DUF3833 family protein [Tropicibacter oceani]
MTYAFFMAIGAVAVLALLWLKARYFGFAAQKAGDYAGDAHAIDLRRDLDGPLICEGVIYGPTGRVSSRFVGDFDVHWEGNRGVMKEHFRYESGSEQHREWQLLLGNDGSIRATAPDLVGEGRGAQSGGSVHLRYRIRLPEDAGGHVLDTIDWMYLAPNGTIVNRSQFRKYGIKVAELVATMRKAEAA